MRSSWPPRIGPLGWRTEVPDGAFGFASAVVVYCSAWVNSVTGADSVGDSPPGKFCRQCNEASARIHQIGNVLPPPENSNQ